MAIKLEKKKQLNAVELISEKDDAIDLESSDLEEYKKTGDVSKLAIISGKEPTKFICNFQLKAGELAAIKNSMLSGSDQDGKPQVALGSWTYRVVKYVLKDIINPSDLPADEKIVMKKDSQGYVHDDLMVILEGIGITNEIFAMYTSLTSTEHRQNAKN